MNLDQERDFIPPSELAHPVTRSLDGLTSLRFIPAMIILVYHYSIIHNPDPDNKFFIFIGLGSVTFFFMLSGFVLSYSYKDVNFRIDRNVSRYIRARVARIFPVYLISLVIALPFFAKTVNAIHYIPMKILAMSGLALAPLGLHAWVPGAACSINCPSWSISAEFFFYMTFPFVFPLMYRKPWIWSMISLLFWVAMGAVAWLIWFRVGGDASVVGDLDLDPFAAIVAQFVKFFPIARFPEFLIGILLFIFWKWKGKTLPNVPLIAAFAAAWGLIYLFRNDLPDIIVNNGLTFIAWAPLILWGANVRRGPIVSKTMIFLGKLSFSIYLLHASMISLVLIVDHRLFGGAFLAASPWYLSASSTILTLALAALLFVTAETPARKFIMGWRRSPAVALAS